MERLDANGLVSKRVLKRGKPGEPPTFGSQVTIHYIGRLLDGTVFESTRERNKPFKFTLGAGEAIQGAAQLPQISFTCPSRFVLTGQRLCSVGPCDRIHVRWRARSGYIGAEVCVWSHRKAAHRRTRYARRV
jgi:hypothetical protein